uniref:Uncharacterized protein n=1 Tax=Geospiza parvula TaxID=87175 RepID=A0A8C3Q8R3_GEOPR
SWHLSKSRKPLAIMVYLQEWDSAHKVAQTTAASSTASLKQGRTRAAAEVPRETDCFWQVTFLSLFPLFLQPCSHRYLTEFLENRGVLIPLEILRLNHLKEEDKREFIKLLLLTGDTSRGYKELVCESCGMQHFLNASSTAEGQKDAQALLDSLGHSNPKYQRQDSQGLEAVVLCTSPQAQHGALQTLRLMQVRSGSCWRLGVLCSVHLEVQYQGKICLPTLGGVG